jgi:hypothetical protein
MEITLVQPTEKTLALMEKLGITEKPVSQQQASAMIWSKQIQIASSMPSQAQKNAVYAIGMDSTQKGVRLTDWVGRDLPGIRNREISLQIALLQGLSAIDLADDQAGINKAAAEMIELVRARLTKPYRKSGAVTEIVAVEDPFLVAEEKAPF